MKRKVLSSILFVLLNSQVYAGTYTVQSGDTIGGIAKKLGFKSYEEANFVVPSGDLSKINVGDEITYDDKGADTSETTKKIQENEKALEEEERAFRGRIFENFKIDLIYGYEILNLRVNTDVEDPDFKDSEGNTLQLTDAGTYDFNDIELEYKKINLDINGFTITYKIEDNKVSRDEYDLEKLYNSDLSNKDLFVEILELTGGYGEIDKTIPLLNHHSVHQISNTSAVFEGRYNRGNVSESVKMDKSKLSYKFMSGFGLYMKEWGFDGEHHGVRTTDDGTTIWSFWEFTTSEETIPQIIYAHSSKTNNGVTVNFVDRDFNLKKYLITGGHDAHFDNGFILGYTIGAGWANFEMSAAAQQEIADLGVTNINTSDNPLLYYGSLKVGYQKTFTFDYTEFDFSLLYTYEGLNVVNSEVDESVDADGNSTGAEDKANIIFDRGEHLNKLLVSLRWTF